MTRASGHEVLPLGKGCRALRWRCWLNWLWMLVRSEANFCSAFICLNLDAARFLG